MMKLQISQENLSKAINIASRYTTSRAQLPVLGNILFSANKSKLNISSTNLEMSVSTSLIAKIENEGEVSVPGKVLADFVNNLPKENLYIESKNEQLNISSSTTSSNILGMGSSDFPKIPTKIDKTKANKLLLSQLSSALSKVIFAVSLDETRPLLTGVYFTHNDDLLTFVATDGFRLSRIITDSKIDVKSFSSLIIPKNILSEILRITDTDEVFYEVKEKEKQIVFEIGNVVLSSRLLEGDFPDYQKIIPKSSDTTVVIDKEDLLQAVKMSAPFARDNANIIKLTTKNEKLIVKAEGSNTGNQENKIDAKIEGQKNLEIAFNYKFLEDFLGSVEGNEIRMEFSGSDKAGKFFDTNNENYLHLIMPVRTQN